MLEVRRKAMRRSHQTSFHLQELANRQCIEELVRDEEARRGGTSTQDGRASAAAALISASASRCSARKGALVSTR